MVPAEGGTGIVIGQAVNRSTSAVDVTFGVAGAPTPATVAVPASSGKTLSDAATGVEIPGIPAAPGEMVEMTVTTAEAGENVVKVPVLREHRLLLGPHRLVLVTRVAGRRPRVRPRTCSPAPAR